MVPMLSEDSGVGKSMSPPSAKAWAGMLLRRGVGSSLNQSWKKK